MIAGAIVLVAIACVAIGVAIQSHRKERFVGESVAQIEALARSQKFIAAWQLAREVERAGGASSLTEVLKDQYTRVIDIDSTPANAAIAFRAYRIDAKDGDWIDFGTTPMARVRVPRGVLEWRATLSGRDPRLLTAGSTKHKRIAFSIPAAEDKDREMVLVPGGEISIGGLTGLKVAQEVKLAPYSIDRTEVTNREYARFVQAGGYAREEFWKHPFRDGSKALGFNEAMTRFKDLTGRAGPAHWKLGSFPEGEGELPVRGISWHEASAYAAYAGKELPTIYHWYFADTGDDFNLVLPALLPAANFGGKGPRAAVASRTIGAFGAIDMAGNVREWVATPTDKDHHIAVGGSWLEVAYQYKHAGQLSALDRPVDVGLRCMKRTGKESPGDVAFARVAERPSRDKHRDPSGERCRIRRLRTLFSKRTALRSMRGSSRPIHRRNIDAAQGELCDRLRERAHERLSLPSQERRSALPTIIFMHGSGVFDIKNTYDEVAERRAGGWLYPEIVVRGGRGASAAGLEGQFRAIRWPGMDARVLSRAHAPVGERASKVRRVPAHTFRGRRRSHRLCRRELRRHVGPESAGHGAPGQGGCPIGGRARGCAVGWRHPAARDRCRHVRAAHQGVGAHVEWPQRYPLPVRNLPGPDVQPPRQPARKEETQGVSGGSLHPGLVRRHGEGHPRLVRRAIRARQAGVAPARAKS
jgi:formylglycine-generating enzyme required for sulfatase activity